MKKKIIAFILCICLISTFCLQPAYAMGAEGAILGGGAAALNLSLSMPQIALLIAAGYGLIYATQHAEEIAQGLSTSLTNAAGNISNGMEQLTYWMEQAAQGEIALASAPNWIDDTVKSWISGLYNSAINNAIADYAAGEEIPAVAFWGEDTVTFNQDVTILRTGRIWNDSVYTHLSCNMTVVSLKNFTGRTDYTTINGKTYYTQHFTWGTSFVTGNAISEFNQKALDFIATIPDNQIIKDTYPSLKNADLYVTAWVDGLIGSAEGSICPEQKVGGIEGAMDIGGIGNIAMPDMDIGDSELLFPDRFFPENAKDMDVVINDVLTGVKEKEISWERYVSDVFVGTPSISIPAEGEADDPIHYPITEEGVGDTPIDKPIDTPINPPANPPAGTPDVVVPEGLEPFTISLKDFFPFCIPFDIADFVNVLCAEPEAPSFEWGFPGPNGTMHKLTIDLSPFDEVAQILRNMELLLFCIGLALITRNQIRG